jgi:hypothetical protein
MDNLDERNTNFDLKANLVEPRPKFPIRAVITAEMPYGNKELHQ